MSPVLLGLNGALRSGKDTTAELVTDWARRQGVVAVRTAFADALKQSFVRLFFPDCNVHEAYQICDRLKKNGELVLVERMEIGPGDSSHLEHRISGRIALQRYGTECHRQVFSDTFWVDNLLPLDKPFENNFVSAFTGVNPDICIVPDVRFDNEAERVIALDGQNWVIERPGYRGDSHASEQGISDKYVRTHILNDGSLDDLTSLVDDVCDTHLRPALEARGLLPQEV